MNVPHPRSRRHLSLPALLLSLAGFLTACGGGGGGGASEPDPGPGPDPDVAPTIVSSPALAARVGEPYAYDADGRVEAQGTAPITFTVLAPDAPELAVDATTGLVTWTPAAAGTVAVTLRATNAAGSDEQAFQVEVAEAPATGDPPTITSTPGTTGRSGVPYAYDDDGAASATGTAPLSWSVVLGPEGLTIDPDDGSVAWIPRLEGTFAVTLRVANEHGADEQAFTIDVAGDPPGVVTPANSTSITYCPPERLDLGPPRPEQHLNVFLPTGQPPLGGWPVVLANSTGGGYATPPLAEVRADGSTALFHELLRAGVALVHHGNTGVGAGRGLFYPPGHPSGRYESFAPSDDNPHKEAEWAVQWVRTQSEFPLDPDRLCVAGASQGAMILAWATLGPDRARAAGSDPVRASTKVRGVLLLRPPTSVWAMDQSPALGSMVVEQFERADLPGVPADFLAQVDEELQKAASPMRFLFETPEARAANRKQPVCLVYDEPVLHVGGEPASFALDPRGFPLLHDAVSQPWIHDTWFGYALWQGLLGLGGGASAFHAASSVFAVRDAVALGPPLDVHTATFTGPFNGEPAGRIALAWLLATLGVDAPL